MAALPKSPAKSPHSRRSSGGGLRPVVPFGLDDGSAVADEEEEEVELGPAPIDREQSGAFASGKSVDEVEYVYG